MIIEFSCIFSTIPRNIMIKYDNNTTVETQLLIQNNELISCTASSQTLIIPEHISHIAPDAFKSLRTQPEEIISPIPLSPQQAAALYKCKSLTITGDHNDLTLDALVLLHELKQISLPNNSHYAVRLGFIFTKDLKTLLYCPRKFEAKIIHIPEGTESICANAFRDCLNIEQVNMPSSVKYIGKSAFANLPHLHLVNYSKNLEYIDDHAFSACPSLSASELNLPSFLKHIGSFAFNNSIYNSINIPNGIEYIGDESFKLGMTKSGDSPQRSPSCSLPSTLKHIGSNALFGARVISVYEGTSTGLIEAIKSDFSRPNSLFNDSVSYQYTFNNTELKAQFDKLQNNELILNIFRQNGTTIKLIIPNSLDKAGLTHLRNIWEKPTFSLKDYYSDCFCLAHDYEEKIKIALSSITQPEHHEYCKQFLSANIHKYIERLVILRDEHQLVNITQLGFMNKYQLQELLALVQKAELYICSAYILHQLGTCDCSNKRSLEL